MHKSIKIIQKKLNPSIFFRKSIPKQATLGIPIPRAIPADLALLGRAKTAADQLRRIKKVNYLGMERLEEKVVS